MRRKVRSSRLTRTNERQNKKQAILFTIGIIILVGILIQFGPLLVNIFGNAVYTLRGGDDRETQEVIKNTLVQPPILTDIPSATQSSRISFNGISPLREGTIEIYVNGRLADEIELESEKFEVDNLSLKKGVNTIKARLVNGEETSPFSEEIEISYISEKPELEVSSPSDGATFTKADKNITVRGKTDPANSVTVNAFKAIVDPDGEYSYLLQLNDGENTITVEATNPAGVSTSQQLKVTYTP